MSQVIESPSPLTGDEVAWHLLEPGAALERLGSDRAMGLSTAEAAQRLARVGPNALRQEAKPSVLRVALGQLMEPMTLMLVAVAVVSVLIGQGSTAAVVVALILLNVVMGTNQELKARASVDALASLQVPQARVIRDRVVLLIPAADLVPGDIVQVEAGDIVPADGRILESATLEAQEAALTGESVPVGKSAEALVGDDIPLGDRSDMLFQNTSVTRGTATMVVTATGMATEVGRIASMLSGVSRTRSPLQRQLDDLTGKIAIVAWATLALILVVGLVRGLSFEALMLLGVSMAVSAIPTGMPTFVQSMLAMGAQQLARAKAIVRNLSDVETLGATSQINTDKTGTLTLNEMTARAVYYAGSWYEVDGEGYAWTGTIRGVAGAPAVDLTPLAYVSALASDATVSRSGEVVGDPTEAAVVVLAQKIGVSVEQTRQAYPRVATVPFDSTYKFMATFHEAPYEGQQRLVGLVKGGPDVVLARCTRALAADGTAVPLEQVRDAVDRANERLGEHGLRVLALAVRAMAVEQADAVAGDPMAAVEDLVLLGLVGIIDPLRPEAIEAVRVAHRAGIDVRMITGDHLVTAQAIAGELGLGPGGMLGTEFARTDDATLERQLPELHVFGRVSPQDKLRLVQVMQARGDVVAMTGDAVNDAAALKQADIGVAMGSGSEVSKQAAKMILTDDNFATLVHAVELGRGIYARIVAYIGYQLTQLFGLVSMFLLATMLNVNGGVALLPLQVLFLNFTLAVIPVIIITIDEAEPGLMDLPPRNPAERIFNRSTGVRWISLGVLLGVLSLLPLLLGPDTPSSEVPTVSVTMAYAVMGLGTALAGLTMRRTTASVLTRPLVPSVLLTLLGVAITIASTEVGFLQDWLRTTELTDAQWGTCIALALVFGVAVELEKWWRRRRTTAPSATAG
ncbi:MAG: cation-transporting P-type ATPase [Candidatus Nanopelagicales bacterium]|nr:cation-transporting P-type ATPase [Candidatus Nanopelagicales bacterium]